MTTQTDIPTLASLDYIPYLDDSGQIDESLQGKVGVYAIFDRDEVLQYIGYSRDVYLSLKQHLVRCPHQCYWIKAQTIDRPSRTILNNIREAWIAENGTTPPGNDGETAKWTQPIDAKALMTEAEQQEYSQLSDELAQMKKRKKIARRVEAEVLAELEKRGVQMQLRFNPKLKESGLLDLK